MDAQLQVQAPDLIIVDESHFEDVDAIAAKLHLHIKGTSFFNTNVAFKRAKELSALVDSLKSTGITEEDFKLLDIQAEVSAGIFSKFSSVNYSVEIKCRDLEKLPDALTAIAGGKNASLDYIEWEYPNEQPSKDDWLKEALSKATKRANIIAESLGIKVVGVHECTSRYWNEEQQSQSPLSQRLKAMSASYDNSLSGTMRRAPLAVDTGFR